MSNSNSKPDNNMVWAILSTFFCCLPFGIVAIVNAAKVDGLWRSGEYEAANEAAANAKKYAKWATVIGIMVNIIVFIVSFAITWSSHSSPSSSFYDDYDGDTIEYVEDSVADYDEVVEDNTDYEELSTQSLRKAIEDDVHNSNRDCPMEAGDGLMITNISNNKKISWDEIAY